MKSAVLLVFVAMSLALGASRSKADARGIDWFPPRARGCGIVAVPKAYYTSEDRFGVGLELVRPYRFPGSTAAAADSDLRAKGRLHVDGHGAAEFEATSHLGEGRWSVRTKVTYEALALRFWGIGSDTPSDAEEIYRPQNVLAYTEVFHRVVGALRLGVRAEWQDYRYVEVETGGLLDAGTLRGSGASSVLGGGVVAAWDTRDNRYAPRRGVYAQAFWLWFGAANTEYEFNNGHLDFRAYFDLGKQNTLAVQAFTFALFGDVPIWRYASVGGRAHSRGYRRDRYLERRMGALQAEWRRPVVARVDAVGFFGLANVARRYDRFTLANMRPSLGAGLRIHPRENRDLTIRSDLAFGEDSVRFYLSFGHAF